MFSVYVVSLYTHIQLQQQFNNLYYCNKTKHLSQQNHGSIQNKNPINSETFQNMWTFVFFLTFIDQRCVHKSVVQRQSPLSPTDIITCEECCDGDYCNLNGCGQAGFHWHIQWNICSNIPCLIRNIHVFARI